MKQPKGQEFLDFFRDIDARLDKESLAGKITLYIFGGAGFLGSFVTEKLKARGCKEIFIFRPCFLRCCVVHL